VRAGLPAGEPGGVDTVRFLDLWSRSCMPTACLCVSLLRSLRSGAAASPLHWAG
jgi:hypothetical protein